MPAKRQVVERVSGVRCQRVTRRVAAEGHGFLFGVFILSMLVGATAEERQVVERVSGSGC